MKIKFVDGTVLSAKSLNEHRVTTGDTSKWVANIVLTGDLSGEMVEGIITPQNTTVLIAFTDEKEVVLEGYSKISHLVVVYNEETMTARVECQLAKEGSAENA